MTVTQPVTLLFRFLLITFDTFNSIQQKVLVNLGHEVVLKSWSTFNNISAKLWPKNIIDVH